jgi:hypothetical protein
LARFLHRNDLASSPNIAMSQLLFLLSSAVLPPNIAVKAAPSGRWTLRDKTPRSAPYLQR